MQGFTLFQYRGKFETGVVYSAGDYSLALVNGDNTEAEVSATMHHELRHIVLGDFGRSAPKALHSQEYLGGGKPQNEADRQTDAADKEALENANQP